MKVLKSLLLTSLCVLLPLSTSMAEGGRGHKGKKMNLDKRIEKMQEKLDLSDEQADQVYDIMKNRKKNSSCKNLESFTERKNCRAASKEAAQSEINALLTPEQQQKFAEMKEKRKERKQRRAR